MEDDALPVDGEGAVGPDCNLAEAHLAAAHVQHAVALAQGHYQVVEVGLLGAPQARVGHTYAAERHLARARDALALLRHHGPVIVHNLYFHPPVREGLALHIDGHRGRGQGVGTVQCCGEEVVAYLCLGRRPQENVARDAGEAPIVLALQEGTAGEAVHAHGDIITSRTDKVGDPELRGQVGILGITSKLSVHPHVVAVAGAIEAHIHIAPLPGVGQVEVPAVGADGVLHGAAIGPIGRAVGHDAPRLGVVGEGIGGVDIQGLVPVLAVAEAIHLPRGGHIDIVPTGGVEVVAEEIGRRLLRRAHPAELPCAVKAEEPGRLCHVVGRHRLLVSKGDAQRMRPFAVQAGDTHVIPLLQRLGAGSYQ